MWRGVKDVAALLDSRQKWRSDDTPWLAIGLGIAATIIIVILHPAIFGGAPLR